MRWRSSRRPGRRLVRRDCRPYDPHRRDIGPEGRVYLYDINRAMMEVGRYKISRSSSVGRIRLIQGDAERMACCSAIRRSHRGVRHPQPDRMRKALKKCIESSAGGKDGLPRVLPPHFPWFRRLYDIYSFHIMPGSESFSPATARRILTFRIHPEISASGRVILQTPGYRLHRGIVPQSDQRDCRDPSSG